MAENWRETVGLGYDWGNGEAGRLQQPAPPDGHLGVSKEPLMAQSISHVPLSQRIPCTSLRLVPARKVGGHDLGTY